MKEGDMEGKFTVAEVEGRPERSQPIASLDIAPGTEYVDIRITFSTEESLERALHAPKENADRLGGFFVKLVRLAREDERLAALMREYVIEVAVGGRTLWP